MANSQNTAPSTGASVAAEIFGDTVLGYGRKHPKTAKLAEIWKVDPNYLRWAANLLPNSRCDSPIPAVQRALISIAHRFDTGKLPPERRQELSDELASFRSWSQAVDQGLGIEALPRPSKEQCLEIISRCTLLAGHADLDGIVSLSAMIRYSDALGGTGRNKGDNQKIPFSKLHLLRYGLRNIEDYSERIGLRKDDVAVVVDFAAHPRAALSLDHHTTCLSYWEFGTPAPVGIYDPAMPSCPRLLATHVGLPIEEDILKACDMIDGAIFESIEQASDLSDPFVALSYALDLDVSDTVAKKVVILLAQNDLDPASILGDEIWQARIKLLELELVEQRRYWGKANRFEFPSKHVAIADGSLAPYSASRFRYVPFENPDSLNRPYMITVRSGQRGSATNIGVGRNPFFDKKQFFTANPLNVGALMRALGGGGGRMEVGSLTCPTVDVRKTLTELTAKIDKSVVVG